MSSGLKSGPSTMLRMVPLPRERGRIRRDRAAGKSSPSKRGRGTTRSVVEGARTRHETMSEHAGSEERVSFHLPRRFRALAEGDVKGPVDLS